MENSTGGSWTESLNTADQTLSLSGGEIHQDKRTDSARAR